MSGCVCECQIGTSNVAIFHVYKDFRGIFDANNCKNIVVSVMIHGVGLLTRIVCERKKERETPMKVNVLFVY